MSGKLADDIRRHLSLAHVVERRVVDDVILAPGPQE